MKILAGAALIILLSSNMLMAKDKFDVTKTQSIDSLFGDKISLKDKVVYLDFWASWCPYCQKSMPWMNKIQKRYEKQGFQIVMVNLDKDPAKGKAFLEKTHTDLPVYFDSTGTLAKKFGIKVMPTSFIYNRDGTIFKKHQGFNDKSTYDLEVVFDSLLVAGVKHEKTEVHK